MRHYRANTPGYKARASKWARDNRPKRKAIIQRNLYGWDPPYPCPDLCEICRRRKARCIDHDHVTGEFRGWVCTPCNTALAAFGDNLEGVLRAVVYLIRKGIKCF